MFFNELEMGRFSSQNDLERPYPDNTIAQQPKHMMETTLEERVEVLEKQVASLLSRLGSQPTQKDWQHTIGMFADDPVMRDIQAEGQKIREADRRKTHRGGMH